MDHKHTEKNENHKWRHSNVNELGGNRFKFTRIGTLHEDHSMKATNTGNQINSNGVIMIDTAEPIHDK